MESKTPSRAGRVSRRVPAAVVLFSLLALAIAALGSASATGAAKGGSVPCGPEGAKTLAAVGGMRIFRNGPVGSEGAAVRVCSRSISGVVSLGHGAAKAPFAIVAPSAAGVETTPTGQDTAEVDLVGVDVSSREQVRCLVGSADRPGQLPKVHRLWLTREGSLVATMTLKLAPAGPLLAVCRPGENALEVIARGSAVKLGSVTVKGNFVSWIEEGKRQTEQV